MEQRKTVLRFFSQKVTIGEVSGHESYIEVLGADQILHMILIGENGMDFITPKEKIIDQIIATGFFQHIDPDGYLFEEELKPRLSKMIDGLYEGFFFAGEFYLDFKFCEGNENSQP